MTTGLDVTDVGDVSCPFRNFVLLIVATVLCAILLFTFFFTGGKLKAKVDNGVFYLRRREGKDEGITISYVDPCFIGNLGSTASRVFTDLLSNSPKRSPRFLPGYEGTENMFYFLNEQNI